MSSNNIYRLGGGHGNWEVSSRIYRKNIFRVRGRLHGKDVTVESPLKPTVKAVFFILPNITEPTSSDTSSELLTRTTNPYFIFTWMCNMHLILDSNTSQNCLTLGLSQISMCLGQKLRHF